jgi:hypothetical protein
MLQKTGKGDNQTRRPEKVREHLFRVITAGSPPNRTSEKADEDNVFK